MDKKLISAATRAMLAGLLCTALLIACRKKDVPAPSVNPGGGVTDTISDAVAEDSLKYLMYQIMQVTYGDGGRTAAGGLPTYYWYSQIPKLNPFDSQYPNADTLLAVMKRYAINSATGRPYDHYSFLDRTGALTNKLMNGVSARALEANNSDFGLEYAPVLSGNNNNGVQLFVLYADKNGPAGRVGVSKGWEITSVNGTTSFTNTYASLRYVYDAIFGSTSSVTLGFRRPDSTLFTATLSPGPYNINPVLFDTVFTVKNQVGASQKVGYFSMYTFASVINDKGQPTNTKTVLDQTFSKFASQGIRNLIVDLRYNGGGSTNTAEYLDSAIAPASAAGKTMYTYKYNDKLMATLNDNKLTTQVNFAAQTSGLLLDHVFFITSRNTASASELTLNNLKPYMSVKLVGDTTYGKPVGFIDFNISAYQKTGAKKYLADLYAINFATHNAKGEGDYYTGIPVDGLAVDYVDVPWGDKRDANLIQVFNYINNGAFKARIAQARVSAAVGGNLHTAIPNAKPLNNFNGMVDYRLSRAVSRIK
ncbi:peptidase S41-like protein [Chitinophaga niastensis]|uniref:Peptidase S41-like protein n=1 Tax=Chitinophaga niastensis TaxID=536980 RepID=A0A2P8HBU9_CHINA|nr:S41 family peptidase [Chitinophaga niastensis]PSL43694.1 peptidase S41-like protein [Chitinophaga niastensis]